MFAGVFFVEHNLCLVIFMQIFPHHVRKQRCEKGILYDVNILLGLKENEVAYVMLNLE